MAFWIHGRDSRTGERTDIFSETATEEAARAEAAAQGMVVESVERDVAQGTAEAEPLQLPSRLPEPSSQDREGGRRYESTQEKVQIIGGLARSMKFVGLFLMIVGALGILVGLFGMHGPVGAASFVQGVFNVLAGVFTVHIGRSFSKVAAAEVRDMSLLMEALSGLGTLYGFLTGLIILMLVFLAVLLAFYT